LRLLLPDAVKINVVQNGTHQLPAAAGYKHVIFRGSIPVVKFFRTFFRCVADTDAAALVHVRTAADTIPFFHPALGRMVKGGSVRFYITAERWRDKTDRAIFRQKLSISHLSFPFFPLLFVFFLFLSVFWCTDRLTFRVMTGTFIP